MKFALRPPALALLFGLISALVLCAVPLAQAQSAGPLTVNVGNDLLNSQRLFQIVALVTVLSIAPSILLMVTSFTRILIVFSFLRSALGLQSSPPNAVLVGLALFLTSFIMAPTQQSAWEQGLRPYLNEQITPEQAFTRTSEPFARFMLANVRENDLSLFLGFLPKTEQAKVVLPEAPIRQADGTLKPAANTNLYVPLQALVPAFMISELRRAFEIGFLIFLPFLVIDLAVASILMSMGMMMLPPVTVSLPFKIIFFVLVDGWHLLTATLIQSFQPPI